MSKTIKGGKILLQLDDGNTIELFSKKTKQAKKSVDSLARSEQTLNRNFKGASQQSSNTTKNFSKMAQGITGGLVPAYATLAANIFAIGAAFRFLQSAGDLRILEQGQAEYATRTGQNLAILTRNLQAATDGQLAFAEAAQAVAIGTAAGLATKQINDLGKVAKNASLMLGRDLTDSFNRLVRGAVKAEPELLDELGIILRLETASEKYALSIGKTKNQLNIFEKSQAVVNEVLAQGLEKFGQVDTQTNSLTKLAKSFDDLVNSLKRAIGPMAEFMAVAMSQNTVALAGAGTLLGTQLTRAIIPKVPDIDFAEAGKSARAKFSKIYSGKRDLDNIDSKGLNALVRDTKKAYAKNSSTVINFEGMKRREALRTLDIIKISIAEEEAARSKGIAGMTARYRLMVAQFKAENNAFVAHIKATGTMAARAFSTALRFVGYAGIIVSVAGVLNQYLDKSSEAEKKTRARQREFGKLFSENAKDLEKMVSELKTFDNLMTNALQSARALSNIDFGNAFRDLGDRLAGKDYAQPGAFGTGQGKIMSALSNVMGKAASALGANVDFDRTLSPDQEKGLRGILAILNAERELLIKGSDAYDQHTNAARDLVELLNNPKSETSFNTVRDFLKDVGENGTIASNSMRGLAQTTQILSSSAQDFSKALNSFRVPQTPLTRLTTNINSVGEALSGLGEAYAKMNVKLKHKMGGGVFDKATVDMLTTFLGPKDMLAMEGYSKLLDHLEGKRQDAIEAGDPVEAFKLEELITKAGANAFTFFGGLTEAKAQKLHKIEMEMIKDKTKVQKNLATLTVGATKLQTSQLQKQAKLAQNQIDIRNQQILITELESLGLQRDDAQIAKENEKLRLMQAQGLELEKQLDDSYQLQQTAKNAFESGFSSGLTDLITGKESSLTESMQKLATGVFEGVAKTLSDQLTRSVSNFLFGDKEMQTYERGAEIIRQAHISGIQQGMGTATGDISTGGETGAAGKVMGFFRGLFGFKKGGITPVYAAAGGTFKGPKSGYPAMLHGNEAVVPLPDGRSIPVSGGMGGNVNVAVNMVTGERTTTSEGSMHQLGSAVAQAVQNELEKQQRPGGMLSPY